METVIFRVCKDKPDPVSMAKAAELIKQGGLVAFPTETVYGLGANGLDEQAVASIYQAKGRPCDNPLILHIADRSEITRLVQKIPENARALMDRFWPGPLTVVLERTPVVPDKVTGGLDTVAVRMPDSAVARALIRLAGVPVAAPSANTSGRPSPTTAQAVLADLTGKIDAVIDAGPANIGLESTVVDCTTPVPTLLRPGGVTAEMLVEVLGAVEIDPALGGGESRPKSPGMKYAHYAPSAPLILLEGDYRKLLNRLISELTRSMAEGKRVGAVVSSETAAALSPRVVTANYGSRTAPAEVAAALYTALRKFDAEPVDVIYAEGIEDTGIGLAVMNRLRKASAYHLIKV